MLYRIAAIGFIFACTSVAWIILAQVVSHRTHQQDTKLKAAVGQLWGTSQSQRTPLLYWTTEETIVTQTPDGQATEHAKERRHLLPLAASRLQVNLHLEHRRKGLLWYATYQVALDAIYTATNATDQPPRPDLRSGPAYFPSCVRRFHPIYRRPIHRPAASSGRALATAVAFSTGPESPDPSFLSIAGFRRVVNTTSATTSSKSPISSWSCTLILTPSTSRAKA